MGTVIAFLLTILIFGLLFILGILLFAYSKIMQIYYKLRGKKEYDPFHAFNGMFGENGNSMGGESSRTTYADSTQNQSSAHSTTESQHGGKRIFTEGEGEYVDFEIIDKDTSSTTK